MLHRVAAEVLEGLKPLTDREFGLFQRLILEEAGIQLAENKRALLVGRLSKRLRALGLKSFGEYYEYVAEDRTRAELVQLLDAVATNETHFFRERAHFDLIQDQIIPQWVAQQQAGLRPARVRVWSAGCSTGQEPYSIAMLLAWYLPLATWDIRVVATDISTKVLNQAERAVWPIDKCREIPERLLKRFMLRGVRSQSGLMAASAELRALVSFRRLNLNSDEVPGEAPFDLVFCRNVLIYFAQPVRDRVVNKLFRCMSSDGYLFLGHAESLLRTGVRTRSVSANVYRHA